MFNTRGKVLEWYQANILSLLLIIGLSMCVTKSIYVSRTIIWDFYLFIALLTNTGILRKQTERTFLNANVSFWL